MESVPTVAVAMLSQVHLCPRPVSPVSASDLPIRLPPSSPGSRFFRWIFAVLAALFQVLRDGAWTELAQ